MRVLVFLVVAMMAVGASGQATKPATRPADGRVVFVIDTNGGLLNKMASIKDELRSAITGLRPDQRFDLITSRFDEPPNLFMRGLSDSSTANKQAAFRFLDDITTSATPDLSTAIIAAMQLRPDVIWIASDGDFDKPDEVLAKVHKVRGQSRVRINTVSTFVGDFGIGDSESSHRLWQLAHDNGGVCVGADGKPISEPKLPKSSGTTPANLPTVFKEP